MSDVAPELLPAAAYITDATGQLGAITDMDLRN